MDPQDLEGKLRIQENRLRLFLDPKDLPFANTEGLEPLEGVIGQDRAVRAISFGLEMQGEGYHLFVCGPQGTKRRTTAKTLIAEMAQKAPSPKDWCYVHNFRLPDTPLALDFPCGQGRIFKNDMASLVNTLYEVLPRAFQSKDYENERQKIEEHFAKAHENLTRDLHEKAQQMNFAINPLPMGLMLVPLAHGKPMTPEDFSKLSPKTRQEYEQSESILNSLVREYLRQSRDLQEECRKTLDELNHRIVVYVTEDPFSRLLNKYAGHEKVRTYLESCRQDIFERFGDFFDSAPREPMAIDPLRLPRIRFSVNLLVEHDPQGTAPVIEEINPNYRNLIGRIEKKAHLGMLYSDFTMIKAGALSKANGGYLILDVHDILMAPFAWEALKRALLSKELNIEDMAESYGWLSYSGLKPEPIPLDVRAVLIGNPFLFYLLQTFDEDFPALFKIKADFSEEIRFDRDTLLSYGRFLASLIKRESLLHFEADAVCALLEQAARWRDHQKKLSLKLADLADLARESSLWAKKANATLVQRPHVQKAVAEWLYRVNLLEEKIQELFAEGTLFVNVEGRQTGQANGLAIADLGGFSFGFPSRITARTFLGHYGVINIEKEARLAGKIHQKSVLILSGFLRGLFAQDMPLSLAATLAFEQNYGLIEGDSATVAELAALLSAVADCPIRQDLAITGSMNQQGEIQPVGGVNEKIEGFFTVCQKKQWTGTQGVIIPQANLVNLMLKDEVIAAVKENQFHIYAVSRVEEALALLTGIPFGIRQEDGSYEKDTLGDRLKKSFDKANALLRLLESKSLQNQTLTQDNAVYSPPQAL